MNLIMKLGSCKKICNREVNTYFDNFDNYKLPEQNNNKEHLYVNL